MIDRFPEEDALLGYERVSAEKEDEAKRVAAERALLLRAYLIRQMGDELFRGWLWSVLTELHTFGQPASTTPMGFPDPLATQFYQGMKAGGWWIWEMFDDLAPDLTSLMRREHQPKPQVELPDVPTPTVPPQALQPRLIP